MQEIKHNCEKCADISKKFADKSKMYADWSEEFADKCQCKE